MTATPVCPACRKPLPLTTVTGSRGNVYPVLDVSLLNLYQGRFYHKPCSPKAYSFYAQESLNVEEFSDAIAKARAVVRDHSSISIVCPECGPVNVLPDVFDGGQPISGDCPACRERLYFAPPDDDRERTPQTLTWG